VAFFVFGGAAIREKSRSLLAAGKPHPRKAWVRDDRCGYRGRKNRLGGYVAFAKAEALPPHSKIGGGRYAGVELTRVAG
jgi:hypothetical protein